jgi:hypothetical protein
MGPAILLSDAISLEDFLSLQNCHHQPKQQVYTVFYGCGITTLKLCVTGIKTINTC